MLNELEKYYFEKSEEQQGVLLFLRSHLLSFSKDITEHFKFRTPFFYFKGKMFCYFSIEKKTNRIYIGFVKGYLMKHKKLISGNRTTIKIFYVPADADIDVQSITAMLKEAVKLYN